MGTVIYKKTNEVIYEGPLVEAFHNRNWNDSMAQYYPVIYLQTGLNTMKTIDVASEYASDFAFEFDSELRSQFLAEQAHREALAEKERMKTQFEKGCQVKVVRGRKIPIGTKATVGWVGETKFGKSLGLMIGDSKQFQFTNAYNCERTDI